MNDLPAHRIALLKEKLAAMPDKQIPELKFLTPERLDQRRLERGFGHRRRGAAGVEQAAG